jgi:hypothetical protein
MEPHAHESIPRAPIALAMALLVVCTVAIALLTSWLAQTFEQLHNVPATSARSACNICGVVEQVRVLENPGPGTESGTVEGGLAGPAAGYQMASRRGEGLLILLSALSAGMSGSAGGGAPAGIYETEVRLEDGSIRVLRDSRAPPWKPGDRVKVIKGRIERVS